MKQPILVLTGSREQYHNWLSHQGLTEADAIYITKEGDYEPLTDFLYANPGTFWENPVYGPRLVSHFHAHGRLYQRAHQQNIRQ